MSKVYTMKVRRSFQTKDEDGNDVTKNRWLADSALEATKDGISLSKKEQSDESQDSSPIDTQQPIEDVRKDLFDKYMEQNPEGSWELFQEEYHYLFHPDEIGVTK